MLRENNFFQGQKYTIKSRNSQIKSGLKVLVFIIICGDVVFLVGAIIYSLYFNWMTANQTISPTVIPWISTEQECKHTRRVWENGECLDAEHSHLF